MHERILGLNNKNADPRNEQVIELCSVVVVARIRSSIFRKCPDPRKSLEQQRREVFLKSLLV